LLPASLQSQELGVADLSIEFPNSGLYPGHFKEKGYNALFINNAANCFARNLRIINAGECIGCLLVMRLTSEHADVPAALHKTCWQIGRDTAVRLA
jgi:hypothetical protein